MSDPKAIEAMQINAPPKGTGVITYVRGANVANRLKGKRDDFNSGYYIDADDGTHVRVVWDPTKSAYCIIARDSKGAFVQLCDGEASMQSPNAENGVYVSNEGVKIIGATIEINGTSFVKIDGGFVGLGLGATRPLPLVNSAVVGPGGPPLVCTGAPSGRVFIGVA